MKNVIYWTSTFLVSAFLAVMAIMVLAYWGHVPKMIAAFTSPSRPAYVAGILGAAKLLGVAFLLLPGLPVLKEWAYAGFTFACAGAMVTSLLTHQTQAVAVPVMALGLLLTSYFTRPSTRRLSFGYRFEFY